MNVIFEINIAVCTIICVRECGLPVYFHSSRGGIPRPCKTGDVTVRTFKQLWTHSTDTSYFLKKKKKYNSELCICVQSRILQQVRNQGDNIRFCHFREVCDITWQRSLFIVPFKQWRQLRLFKLRFVHFELCLWSPHCVIELFLSVSIRFCDLNVASRHPYTPCHYTPLPAPQVPHLFCLHFHAGMVL